MTPQAIPRVPLVSRERFAASWEKAGHPVIFTGATRDWPAASKWSFEWFRATHGDVEITVRSALYTWGALPGTAEPLGGARRMKLATYLDEVEASAALPLASDLDALADTMLEKRPEDINHLVGPSLLRAVPSLREDARFPDYAPRWLNRLTESSVWIAPRGTFAQLHRDRAHNLYAQLSGRKRWQLYSPARARLLQPAPLDWAADLSGVDLKPGAARRTTASGLRPDYDFILEPGELLFLPVHWWHRVHTLSPAIAANLWWWDIPTTVRVGPVAARVALQMKLQEAYTLLRRSLPRG
ncbi:cupin-like domain-containing protein [Pyxidicoccus trucidator]|uniref:cupin-like domain-containing protein n=1 Tax=Pyxidicoccus trucidator TaxID=2709662 RepID=UPI0013DBE800|nr:cupin-like domain-containing protein [Pyxidicoccus trucidator]